MNQTVSNIKTKRKLRALPRVLCVVGPTAAGKTEFGLQIAKIFQGEVINADARQVYKGCSIGTGKPLNGQVKIIQHRRAYVVDGVPHYLMDFLPPTETFTVTQWREKALKAIRYIAARGHLPIVVGGTGMYIQALIDGYRIPPVPPQPAFRAAMDAKSLDELVQLLSHTDPEALQIVDLKNRRRVLRALEVITFSGKPFSAQRSKARPTVEAFLIAPFRTKDDLHKRIDQTIDHMIEEGWIDEVRALRAAGLSKDAPAMTSIGYRDLLRYLEGDSSLEETIEHIKRATKQYAKRQMTWFKRDKRIHWVDSEDEAKELVRQWLVEKSARGNI